MIVNQFSRIIGITKDVRVDLVDTLHKSYFENRLNVYIDGSIGITRAYTLEAQAEYERVKMIEMLLK